MEWIDYNKPKYRNTRMFTRQEVGVMADILGWAKMTSKTVAEQDVIEKAIQRFHKESAKWPHQHLQSINGAYCVACHCDIPEDHWGD